ncbi:sodium/panthothenate symporter [Fictibacillus macauensis ZFHKF-1]|uniref:Sodium/panthothenate symporter n=1 Tax=Fictibacillus macauensis ZFHKF-1 TaxID=1196324 RepID=I8AEX9_9BACL|nr:sodium/pantothenate symporter [Fictibacillus macauensis]EIT83909.1 sodium/panthothenate symporter [Fictibacillus macauensis ZFHKF-1]
MNANWQVIVPLIAFLVLMFLVGMYTARAARGSEGFLQDYFLGGRHLGGFVLALTMVATYGSASSFIGGPGIAYNMGLGWVLLSMAQLVTGYFTLAVLGKKFAIIARKINAVTLIDFLKARYESKWVVILAAASISIFLFSATAAQWVGGGRLIESFTGVSYGVALFIFSFSVLVYVIAGGFRAVVITDTLMGIVMFVGTLVILAGTIIAGHGVPTIIHKLSIENPNLITPFGADHSLSPLYVSSFWLLVGIGVVGLPQIAVRAMSYRNSKAMHQAMIIGTFVVGFIMLGMHLTGVFARVVMPGITVGDKVMPLLALKVLPEWLAGIVLAAPLAAVMSTVNSILLIVSSSIVKDVYINYIKPDASEAHIKKLSFSVTAAIGVLVFLAAIKPPDLLIWLNLFSFGGLEASFIWPVVLGLYWKRGNASGALSSILVGVLSYIALDQFYPNAFGMHTVVLPVLLSLIAYIVGSLLFAKKHPLSELL